MRSNFFLILVCAGLVGCTIGDVPAALRIDSGMDPDKQDQYTRFRTTYYFRVLDSCKIDGNHSLDDYAPGILKERKSGKTKVVNDTVYRFRMTGKASALFNKITFGSGVLRADQIDPFGSSVEYKNGRFEVKTGSIARQKELRGGLIEEIRELRELQDSLTKDPAQPLALEEIQRIITDRVKLLNGGGAAPSTAPSDETSSNALCPEGRPIKKSYFLYGPEGVRELDPDERLLMAMSSDSKPLIGMLEELSGRQRKALSAASGGANILVQEENWIADSKDKLNQFEKSLENNLEKSLKNEKNTSGNPMDVVDRLIGQRRTREGLNNSGSETREVQDDSRYD
ncbi:MAG: hypothetical protein H8K07_16305 [Nitrospira sp.]|nr:hypothetical protein [Nitrospira sp.]